MKITERMIIWGNMNINPEDWKEEYKEFIEINELDRDPEDYYGLSEWVNEENGYYLEAERENLDIQLSQPIIVIGDFGRWNGRVTGYKEITSGNIADCLYSNCDYVEWYIDKLGDLRADASHHDGSNHYLYRVFKDDVTDRQKENFEYKIYTGTVTRKDITRMTRRLGDEIAEVYGFNISGSRNLTK